MKTVITVTGIRPDFIRMAEIFRKLDQNFKHILINTNQHYDYLLSDVFFEELSIRKPDYNLHIGGQGQQHYHQLAELSVKLPELLKTLPKPDIILFLGDSNSVLVAPVLKKEGYKIGHIEAGMRSGDKRMLEETNRIVCDHCSDLLFVYHEDYKLLLQKEGIKPENIFVVGNTIVEVVNKYKNLFTEPKTKDFILCDIHRPENFNSADRMKNIVSFIKKTSLFYKVPVKFLSFKRTIDKIKEFNIDMTGIELYPLVSYKSFLQLQYNCLFLVSDSGTGQEEPALLKTPVVVPRDFTERPQSLWYWCSEMLNVNTINNKTWDKAIYFVDSHSVFHTQWLGNGNASDMIIEVLKKTL